jgi:hypothetical protein
MMSLWKGGLRIGGPLPRKLPDNTLPTEAQLSITHPVETKKPGPGPRSLLINKNQMMSTPDGRKKPVITTLQEKKKPSSASRNTFYQHQSPSFPNRNHSSNQLPGKKLLPITISIISCFYKIQMKKIELKKPSTITGEPIGENVTELTPNHDSFGPPIP